MSSHLWKAFYEDDVDTFRQLLAATAGNARSQVARGAQGFHIGSLGSIVGSPAQQSSSPTHVARNRKAATPGSQYTGLVLTKTDINMRDTYGLTVLHHAASSTSDNAVAFATALIEHPLIDLCLQDPENGWTALHRAFYFGNVTIARMILERNAGDALGKTTGHVHQTLGLVKIKDREGHGPLDLYAATIKDRTLRPDVSGRPRAISTGSDDDRAQGDHGEALSTLSIAYNDVDGDQLFTFGSNKNVSLGFGDEDDRQFPERINLRRPESLLRKLYTEHAEKTQRKWCAHEASAPPVNAAEMWIEDIPWTVRSQPLSIQDVQMSKLHTAVLTNDTESNLYMCGHGQGGRLGTGDERTRYNFVCVEGPALAGKRVVTVVLGLNHTLALSDRGEIFSWGSNGYGQLGYSLPKVAKDEEPISTIARQIYGPLKRETIIGIAASRIHSVAHSATSLFTFGKNEGQLGIVDSDARSLDTQMIPRKVAASLFTSSISAVSAIDRATVCLLENHDVWIFANYGYAKVPFPLDGFANYFLKQSFLLTTYDQAPNRISKITSAGDTVCALSTKGEVYTLSINQKLDSMVSASTTNPAKIRSAITQPQRIWSPKKNNMAARDVGLDVDGSIIVSTEEGSVWKRTSRATVTASSEYKPKDYKFSRIPGLTRVLAVRASGHGAYAAVRRDCDVLKRQIIVEDPKLWQDLMPLLSLKRLIEPRMRIEDDELRHRFWQGSKKPTEYALLRMHMISSADPEADVGNVIEQIFADGQDKFDAVLATSTSDVILPVHRFILTGRSRTLRRGFRALCESSIFTIPDLAVAETNKSGQVVVKFQGVDILTIIDLALYLYTDEVIDFWHFVRDAPTMAFRYRTVRTDLMKIAAKLELSKLETAVRQMVEPQRCLNADLESAVNEPAFFLDADVVVQLEDDEKRVHSTLWCARCPFFDGLFRGRAAGRWLTGRGEASDITVDLKHINSKTFDIILRHVYYDAGDELFDQIVSTDLDDFLDSVLDVMSAANELMLDRLSQITQSIIGRFVNVRNVCGLLNAIAPSSVHEFKDAGLEYLCLNLEAMLQGHFLNELDEDLLEELDEVVRQNQLACMPFAKSGRAELLLHERHPELAAVIDRNRRVKIDSLTLRSKFHDAGTFAPGSFSEELSLSPTAQKSRRRSSTAVKADLDRPSNKTKSYSKDMMFEMDEESDFNPQSPRESPAIRPLASPRGLDPILQSSPPDDVWYDSKGKILPSPRLAPQLSASASGAVTPRTPRSPSLAGKSPPIPAKPWTLTPLTTAKTDMREIMAQTAHTGRTSSLTASLAAARNSFTDAPSPFSLPAPKMSQKERKRMQQAQQANSSTIQSDPAPNESSPFSWQSVSAQSKTTLKDVIANEQSSARSKAVAPTRTPSTPQLTMRQTVAHVKTGNVPKSVIGPGSSSNLQQRSVSDSKQAAVSAHSSPHEKQGMSHFSASRPIPQSIRHQPVIDPAWGLSMSEIVAQQQLEKDIIREAAAKRDLQEIQAEQEFQEWWDKESARVQEAEKRNAAAPGISGKASGKKHRSRGGRSKGAKVAAGDGAAGHANSGSQAAFAATSK